MDLQLSRPIKLVVTPLMLAPLNQPELSAAAVEDPVTRRPEVLALYRKPLPSARTGPLYNAFSYPTKISPEAIAVYIATHTDPGATVLDMFAGSGTTGIAAKLCDRPTPEMLRISHEMGLNPTWGPRHAVLYELGVIGSFVAEVMCDPPDPELFEKEAVALVADAYSTLRPLLEVIDDQGKVGILRHAIWSEVLVCPHCRTEHSFWDAAVEQSPLRLRSGSEPYQCPACKKSIAADQTDRATERVFDRLLKKRIERRKRVLVRVYGTTGKRKWQRQALPSDAVRLKKVSSFAIPPKTPIAKLRLGDLYRSGYHFGMTHLHHLYTQRNLICVSTLLKLIDRRDESVRKALRLLVLSYNQAHATLMTRVVVKDGQSDFVLTGAQSGVLYVSGLPVEKNVLEGITRKVKSLRDSFELMRNSRSTVSVHNRSSTSLGEPDASIDYVFTDPPFADFIPYAEINQVNELWLGKRTNNKNEAVVSEAQGKSLDDYGRLMSAVFKEAARVLKPNGLATVVFHAAKASVWATLQSAYRAAGFEVAATSVLDKLQVSFKQVVSTTSVKGDPLLLLTKSPVKGTADVSGEDLVESVISNAKLTNDPAESEVTRLYSRYVVRCLAAGRKVDLNADEFYKKARAVEAL